MSFSERIALHNSRRLFHPSSKTSVGVASDQRPSNAAWLNDSAGSIKVKEKSENSEDRASGPIPASNGNVTHEVNSADDSPPGSGTNRDRVSMDATED